MANQRNQLRKARRGQFDLVKVLYLAFISIEVPENITNEPFGCFLGVGLVEFDGFFVELSDVQVFG